MNAPRTLSRLLRPATVAVIGGGAWCRSVLEQLSKAGFDGDVWHVHPRAGAFARIEDLPAAPDAAFIGINRDATIEAVRSLNRIGAGGAVCFASGFSEVGDGLDLNAALLEAAGDMPLLGPNCYGMINALDGALLWPDQHGCTRVERGVAILTQSSNIAINLTMQARGLPIAYMITCGNQAQTSQAEIATALLEDPRVSAIGVHVEGFGPTDAWHGLAIEAARRGVPVVALKIGRSEAARDATLSHTASLAGSHAGGVALLEHLGITHVDDLATLLETLKLLHVVGPLSSARIASISCSGGEASLMSDLGEAQGLEFPALSEAQRDRLFDVLGPRVALSNPLDYHTYIWRDATAMTDAFSAMIEPVLALTCLIVDFPRTDRCDDSDWDCAVQAALAARKRTDRPLAMIATLPELMPETRAAELLSGGVVPLNGLREAVAAIAAAQRRSPFPGPPLGPGPSREAVLLTEGEAKARLQAAGLSVPQGVSGPLETLQAWAQARPGPFALKSLGLAHKSEGGGVRLNLDAQSLEEAARHMPGDRYLVEEMVTDGIAELLIGVMRDPAHGFVLTIGAGGVLTELVADTQSVLLPTSRERLKQCLFRLKTAPVLGGYRGRPGACVDAILDTIEALETFVIANADRLEEVEINPLICTPERAVAADALLRIAPKDNLQETS